MAGRNDKSDRPRGASGDLLTPEQRKAAWSDLDKWRRMALSDANLTPAAFRVGYALTLNVDWGTLAGGCVSQAALAETTGLNKRTVLESLKLLQSRGYVASAPRWNASKRYRLTLPEVQEFSLRKAMTEPGQESDKCRNSHFGSAGILTSKVKNPATYISESVSISCAVPSEARLGAPSSVTSRAAGVDRLGVHASDGKNSPKLPDSSPSPAGSLTRLTARSPAEEWEPPHGHGTEPLDPGPMTEDERAEPSDPEEQAPLCMDDDDDIPF